MTPLRWSRDGLLLAVRATPGSSRSAVTGLHVASDGSVSLAVKVTAPPDKGKANRAVIETLARASGLPKSAFQLVAGETDRHKILRITGNPAGVEAWIGRLSDTGKDS